jgi:hypothetical protein
MLSTIYYLGALDAKPLFICEETISLSGHIDIIMHSYPMTDTKTRVVTNQPTSNLAMRLVDCLPQQGSDWSIAPK